MILATETQVKAKKQKKEKPKETTPEFIASMAVILVTGLFIITFTLQAFEIPSESMVGTLLIGDHVFVDRVRVAPKSSWISWLVPYRDLRRGDLVVFLSPSQPGLYVVKRVIGAPGDRLHLRDGALYVNGQKQDEPYVRHEGDLNLYRDNFPQVTPMFGDQVTQEWQLTQRNYIEGDDLVVPPDRYFAMGDNRDRSLDSRYWGFIPKENVIGRPMFIYWSFNTPEGQYMKRTIGERIGFIFHIVIHFFDETRWSRMFHVVR
jgi:signal peptidase I